MNPATLLVRTRGLGKAYPRVTRRRDRLRSLLSLLAGGRGAERVPVLSDVDLDVYRGQSVGLIGSNGAGKSTLLKLVTGVLNPTQGSLQVEGRIGALLELGAGFHPDYTGRENVAMAAALYGLSVEETRTRMGDILDFADIGDYIDEPVKHYSSGMVVRLGFAVVAAARPDLLITDEVLAVGDEAFQKKCIQWIENYLDAGGTLLLVSHSMYHIQKLCHQAFEGEFAVICMTLNGATAVDTPLHVAPGDTVQVTAELHSRDGRVPVGMVSFVRGDGSGIYGVGTDMDQVRPQRLDECRFLIRIDFCNLALLPGQYLIRVHVLDSEAVRLFDTKEAKLTVRGASREQGVVRLPHVWQMDGK